MATINVTNERKMLDISANGEKVSVRGAVTVGSTGKVESMSGDIYMNGSESDGIIIGNFSLTVINMHADKYASYRTEASRLIDESVSYAESLYQAEEGGVA